MTIYDVFNGDADGICALVQLRNHEPLSSTLITGVKRDINLLKRVNAEFEDMVNVLDISMDKNKADLLRILETGAQVFYCDHHVAGDLPQNENLDVLVNTAPDVCTSLLINGRLEGKYVGWAIVGAYGDNLKKSAEALAKTRNIPAQQLRAMDKLGVYINYNGYGASIDDLHFSPSDLFEKVVCFEDPINFVESDRATFEKLEEGYHSDMRSAEQSPKLHDTDVAVAHLLPNEKWARRVSGVFGNALANAAPSKVHAVLTEKADGSYLVSVRAPLNNKVRADELCMEFPTGGGRKAAAGINELPADMLTNFLDRLEATYR